MAMQAFAAPGAPLVMAEPTYEDPLRYGEPHPYRVVRVPLTGGFAHDIGRMKEEAEEDGRPAVVYICNPANPTGTLTPCADVDRWIEDAPERVTFIVDEAYFPFVDDPSYWTEARWVRSRTNVVVTRTFSKMYGMAGLRLGYGLAHPHTATRLRDFASGSNANTLALAAALAALDDAEWVARSMETWAASRRVVTDCLDELGLEHLPSHTAFLFHRIDGDLETYIRRMDEEGIKVGRPFPPMLSYNRLSLSALPEEMERFADTLRTFRRRGWV